MNPTIKEMRRPVRQRLKRDMQKSNDTRYARRVQAMLLLYNGESVSEVSLIMGAGRSAIQYKENIYGTTVRVFGAMKNQENIKAASETGYISTNQLS